MSVPATLRQQLAALVAPPRTGVVSVPTGLAALDQVLSGGGLPCGRLTEIAGARGSGRTTLARQLVAGALAARRWVAYVDGARTLAPRDWAALGDTGRFTVVRPPNADRGAWCADILLRSGAFGMVVLDGIPPLSRPVAARLIRLAQEHDVALVLLAGDGAPGVVGSAVRLRVGKRREGAPSTGRQMATGGRSGERSAGGGRGGGGAGGGGTMLRLATRGEWPGRSARSPLESRITIQVLVEKGGRHQSVEVCCAIDVAHRLCAHPEVPDRRGVARRNRQGERTPAGVPGGAIARNSETRSASARSASARRLGAR